jgi:hypothetical protein
MLESFTDLGFGLQEKVHLLKGLVDLLLSHVYDGPLLLKVSKKLSANRVLKSHCVCITVISVHYTG